MLKIGEFSKLSRVSVRMLRHYDEIGLLKPAEIDRFTDWAFPLRISSGSLKSMMTVRKWSNSFLHVRRNWRPYQRIQHIS